MTSVIDKRLRRPNGARTSPADTANFQRPLLSELHRHAVHPSYVLVPTVDMLLLPPGGAHSKAGIILVYE